MPKKPKLIYLLLSFVLVLSLSLGGGCVYVQEPSPASAPSPPPPDISAPTNPEWTLPPQSSENPPLPDFTLVVAKVKPSVVAINTEVVTYDIFNRPSTEQGSGSGWIIDENGHIVTNNHVIAGARSITVTLADGRVLSAGVVGADSFSDLAVIKIEDADLPPLTIGDSSELNIGEWALAIGNALGMGISAKEGIVSRLGVSVPVAAGQTMHDLIETSAAINPGNSGGPLVNMAGEVIGITSAKWAAVGVEGLGYAISSDTARPIIEELIQKGYVVRPWLGVVVGTVNEWLVARYELAVAQGVFVTQVAPSSPADEAGIKAGDIIVGWNETEIASADDLIEAIHESQIGQTVDITFWRGNEKYTTTATLAETPPP